jgi:hypothetical protein
MLLGKESLDSEDGEDAHRGWLFLFLIVLALVCVVVQALMPVSRGKSNVRFTGSLLVGIVFGAEALLQIAFRYRLWPEVLLLLMGGLLIWVGARKRNRDPEGRTPPAATL